MIKTVVVTAASEKIGSSLSAALLGERIHLVLLDSIPEQNLSALVSRLLIDRQLQQFPIQAKVTFKGDVDFHRLDEIASLFQELKPDIVVNYATPFKWHKHATQPQLSGIRRAGLGTFIALEAITPMLIGQALHIAGISPHFIVGNLPDMIIPVLCASEQWKPLVKPIIGIGCIELMKYALTNELKRQADFRHAPLNIDLVAHQIHWEASRASDMQQDVPFLLRLKFDEQEVTNSLDDAKTFLKQAIFNNYEPGQGVANTAGLLAYKVVLALLNHRNLTRIHLHSPKAMGIGMPCLVSAQGVELDLPKDWNKEMVQSAAKAAQKADGIEQIKAGGEIKFSLLARKTLKDTMGFKLPEKITPEDFAEVARAQIACLAE